MPRPLHLCLLASTSLILAVATTRNAAALTIVPYFDSSISGAPDAAQVESAIDTAISTIDRLYANSGTVSIAFAQQNGVLGESQTGLSLMSYAAYLSAAQAAAARQPDNSVLAEGITTLPSSTAAHDPIAITTAEARVVLGLSVGAGVSYDGGIYDGVVTLGTSSTPLFYTNTPVSNAYSAIATAEHEIDEVLGGGGPGSMLNAVAANNATLKSYMGALDLYRYSAPGTLSFSTSAQSAYFSVDGGASSVVGFNQNGGSCSGDCADYGDFAPDGYVQSAFGTLGIQPTYDMTSPEIPMMEVLGYDAVAAPEPASLALLVAGTGILGALRRRKVQQPGLREA